MRDCDALANVVNPYCSFTTPENWGRPVHKMIKESGGFSMEFWIKIMPNTRIPTNNEDYEANPTSMRRIVFFNKVSPPRVLAAITLRSSLDDVELQAFGNCLADNKARISTNFPKAEPLKAGRWIKLAFVFGAKNKYGKRGIKIVQGSQNAFQYMDELSWCETDDDFVQAIQLPGGVFMSPIEITPKPIYMKELQERYYHQADLFKVRPA
jgi:hypothetical protein